MKNNIPEELLHYSWRVKHFDHEKMTTTSGDPIEIIKYGDHNTNAGPDFLNATVKIRDVTWVGHVEMHVNSSDWIKHNHTIDPAYNNVILHVVIHEDTIIRDNSNNAIPCFLLKARIDKTLLAKYAQITHATTWVPCQPLIGSVKDITKMSAINRMVAERLENKAIEILKLNEANNGDFLETIYQRLGWAFGLKVNADAFLHLCQKTPFKYIAKHADSLYQLEAFLFGQSGLIPNDNATDDYVQSLIKEYKFFSTKFNLSPQKKVEWKYMRMRPSGFPTIRVAQFAKFLHCIGRVDQFLFDSDLDTLKQSLRIKLNDGFWYSHYTFGEVSTPKVKSIGADKLNSIIINAVSPLLFAYGQLKSSDIHKERAMNLLESIKAEQNSILSAWNGLGMPNDNASDSQGLLHLKKHYCDKSRCLECSIGHKILRQ